jgi:hypothetical protein
MRHHRPLQVALAVLVLLGLLAQPAVARHGGEPTSTMSVEARRVAYEAFEHIAAERAARNLPALQAYVDWSEAQRHAVALRDGSPYDATAHHRFYTANDMGRLRIVTFRSTTDATSGAAVAAMMQSSFRDSLLTRQADYVAVGVACTGGTVGLVVHLLASTPEVEGRPHGGQPATPVVTQPTDGTRCSQSGAHPRPPVAVDPAAADPSHPDVVVRRSAGSDRITTAVAVSRLRHPSGGVPLAMVATGNAFPDAIAVGPAATVRGAPLLLAWRDQLPPATAEELRRLRPAQIAVIGGTAAISDAVASQLARIAPVVRWSGADRTATAARVADAVWPGRTGAVYLAPGETHPAALVAAVPAGHRDAPLLLTWRDRLPSVTAAALRRLDPAVVVVVSGTTAVQQRVLDEVARTVPRAAVQRLDAADDVQLSARVARVSPGDTGLALTTIQRFPDALTAAPLAVETDARMLLVPSRGTVPRALLDAAASRCPQRLEVVGGSGAVDARVVRQVLGAVDARC